MSLRDRVPVEPLDEVRLERLEQRVVAAAGPLLARPRRAPWAPWLVAGTAALAAAAVVLAVGAGRERDAGEVGAPAPVRVATDERGTRLDVGDATIDVGPATRFEVVRAGGGVTVELTAGEVTLEVPPRAGRPPLWVRAGDVGVRVVGTGFRVRRAATVEVEVTHGAVEVHRGAALATVATGQRWSSTDGAVVALAAGDDSTAADTLAADGLAADASAAAAGTSAGTLAADALALGPPVDLAGLHERRATGGPKAPPSPARSTSAGPERARPPARPSAAREARPRRAAPAVAPAPSLSAAELAALSGDLRRELAAQPIAPAPLLPAGTTATTAEERARAYRDLGFKTRADASGFLWGLARTQALELEKDSDALRTLDYHVKRFGSSGGQLEAVLWLRVRLLCRVRLDEPCRAAAHTYLARFAGTAKADVALRITRAR